MKDQKRKKRLTRPREDESKVRQRILDAAFHAFMTKGYAASSTLEIATKARVSKRELYVLVGKKEQILISCITERAKRLKTLSNLPDPRNQEDLRQILTDFGAQLVREVTDPPVVAVFRLAIAEVIHSPEVAQALDSIGRQASRTAINAIMSRAVTSKLVDGNPTDLSAEYGALLLGDVMVSLLLGVTERPSEKEAVARARRAADALISLHQR